MSFPSAPIALNSVLSVKDKVRMSDTWPYIYSIYCNPSRVVLPIRIQEESKSCTSHPVNNFRPITVLDETLSLFVPHNSISYISHHGLSLPNISTLFCTIWTLSNNSFCICRKYYYVVLIVSMHCAWLISVRIDQQHYSYCCVHRAHGSSAQVCTTCRGELLKLKIQLIVNDWCALSSNRNYVCCLQSSFYTFCTVNIKAIFLINATCVLMCLLGILIHKSIISINHPLSPRNYFHNCF